MQQTRKRRSAGETLRLFKTFLPYFSRTCQCSCWTCSARR